MDLRQAADRALGSLRATGDDAAIRRGGFPDHLVVGCGARRQDGLALVALTRRGVLAAGTVALAFPALRIASAQDQKPGAERHGISAFGDLGYTADFKNLAYVNPSAPKGGLYSEVVSSRGYNGSFLTFNSLNAYIFKGEGVFGMDLTFASLMVAAQDEPD